MIAEKLEPLVGAGAVARAGQCGYVGERLLEQGGLGEAVTDALLDARDDCTAPPRLAPGG